MYQVGKIVISLKKKNFNKVNKVLKCFFKLIINLGIFFKIKN